MINKMITRYRLECGILENITPHTFRRTFATNLYRKTKDIYKVSKRLGHKSAMTTFIYL